jgi:hypothetical protein
LTADFTIREIGRMNVYIPSMVLNRGDQTGKISGRDSLCGDWQGIVRRVDVGGR